MKKLAASILFWTLSNQGALAASSSDSNKVIYEADGLRLEMHKNGQHPVKGKYLVTMNYVPNVIENTPPYRALVMTIDGDGKVEVLRKFFSTQARIWAIDLKLQPDGLYSFALNRPRPPVWVYDHRFLDPLTGNEVIEPKGYPIRDPDLDGHETVVYSGDRRIFLFYRPRQEDGKNYIDMEVSAISQKSGDTVGKWSSRNLFPADMTGDYLHFNSLSPMTEDRVLASARSTSTLYLINLATGKIDGQIDSKSWKVVNDSLNGFARQHFAHFLPNGNLMLFDNRDETEENANSRAVEYAVDWTSQTLTLVWEHRASNAMRFRFGWGSAEVIADDQRLIGWGDYSRTKGICKDKTELAPVFSHISKDKTPVFELLAPCGWSTYRVHFVPEK